jgi:cytochrome c553
MTRTSLLITSAFAALTLLPVHAVAADKAYGEYLASECAGCHRPSGPQIGAMPAIYGKPAAELTKALREYRDKTRSNSVMQSVATKLLDDDIEALAAYYSALPKGK